MFGDSKSSSIEAVKDSNIVLTVQAMAPEMVTERYAEVLFEDF